MLFPERGQNLVDIVVFVSPACAVLNLEDLVLCILDNSVLWRSLRIVAKQTLAAALRAKCRPVFLRGAPWILIGAP